MNILKVELNVARILSFAIIVLQQRSRAVVEGAADLRLSLRSLSARLAQEPTSLHIVTYRLEEDSGLTQDVAGFNKLLHALTELLVRVIHLDEPQLVFGQLRIKFINGLRSARSNSGEGQAIIERSYRNCLLLFLDLGCEETDTTGHLINAANFANIRALERVDVRVQLRGALSNHICRIIGSVRTSLN